MQWNYAFIDFLAIICLLKIRNSIQPFPFLYFIQAFLNKLSLHRTNWLFSPNLMSITPTQVIFPGSLLWIPVSTIAALLYWPTLQCLLILAVIYIVMILVPATFMSDTVLTSRAANLIMRYFRYIVSIDLFIYIAHWRTTQKHTWS